MIVLCKAICIAVVGTVAVLFLFGSFGIVADAMDSMSKKHEKFRDLLTIEKVCIVIWSVVLLALAAAALAGLVMFVIGA